MAIKLGKDGIGTPPFGDGIISATYTEECETVDVSNRDNVGDGVGKKAFLAGFTTKTWEIECHDANAVIAELEEDNSSGFTVMSVSENIGIDGAVTYSLTVKEAS
jgi:hypothetical protein